MPDPGTSLVPPSLLGLARDPQVVLNWSSAHQQIPFLAEVQVARAHITALRCDPMLSDAEAARADAESAYNEIVFGGDGDAEEAERRVEAAKRRLEELRAHFEREGACSLGTPAIVGVAAVLSPVGAPPEDMADNRPNVAEGAVRAARAYEEAHGRSVKDVSGEHEDWPYDLHSTGAGGVRCIEVKGTTTGRILLSETERRAAHRFGPSYYLYVVRDPLGATRLTIIRDPLSSMTHDDTLYGSVRYVYEAKTWQAAANEETL